MKRNVSFLSHLHPVKLSTPMAPYSFVNVHLKIQTEASNYLPQAVAVRLNKIIRNFHF